MMPSTHELWLKRFGSADAIKRRLSGDGAARPNSPPFATAAEMSEGEQKLMALLHEAEARLAQAEEAAKVAIEATASADARAATAESRAAAAEFSSQVSEQAAAQTEQRLSDLRSRQNKVDARATATNLFLQQRQPSRWSEQTQVAVEAFLQSDEQQLAACRAHIAAARVPESTSASGRLELHRKGARRIDSEQSARGGLPANWSQVSDLGWPDEEEAALAVAQAPDKVTIITETPPWLDCLVNTYRCMFCQR